MEKKGNQEPWFERLKEEHQDLTEKMQRLIVFMNSEKFYTLSDGMKKVLNNQKVAMEAYLKCLSQRLYEDVDRPGAVADMSMLGLMMGLFNPSVPFSSPTQAEPKKEGTA